MLWQNRSCGGYKNPGLFFLCRCGFTNNTLTITEKRKIKLFSYMVEKENNRVYNTKKKISKRLLSFLLIVIISLNIFPIVWILLSSFKCRVDFMAMPPKLLFKPIIDNYVNMLITKAFSKVFLNSIIIASTSVLLSLVLGSFAGYAFSRFNFNSGKHLLFWILSTRMFPPITTVLPYFIIMSKIHLLGTYQALILVYTTFSLPFSVWMIKGFLDEIPKEIDEAALIDGCSRFELLWRIILPLITPGLAATAIFCLIFSWNEFMMAYILSGSSTHTVPVAISGLVASHSTDWGGIAAMGSLSLIPVVIFVFLAQKYIVRGLTFGAVKGGS